MLSLALLLLQHHFLFGLIQVLGLALLEPHHMPKLRLPLFCLGTFWYRSHTHYIPCNIWMLKPLLIFGHMWVLEQSSLVFSHTLCTLYHIWMQESPFSTF